MGTCHPMATSKDIDSVILLPVNIQLRNKNELGSGNTTPQINGNYNTIIPSPLSAERDNSRQLAGGNARARNSEGIITHNTLGLVSCRARPHLQFVHYRAQQPRYYHAQHSTAKVLWYSSGCPASRNFVSLFFSPNSYFCPTFCFYSYFLTKILL